jgi:hypothetical protein
MAGIPDHDPRWSLHWLRTWLSSISHSLALWQANPIHGRRAGQQGKEDQLKMFVYGGYIIFAPH